MQLRDREVQGFREKGLVKPSEFSVWRSGSANQILVA